MRKERYVTRKVKVLKTKCQMVDVISGKFFEQECFIPYKDYKKKSTLLKAFDRKYSEHPVYVKDIDYPCTIEIKTFKQSLEGFIKSADLISVENMPTKNN